MYIKTFKMDKKIITLYMDHQKLKYSLKIDINTRTLLP